MPLKGKLTLSPYAPYYYSKLNFVENQKLKINKKYDSSRLNFLKSFFNLHNCSFKRMPVPILNKFGTDFYRINKFIDESMNSLVGTESPKSKVLEETITGTTSFGDGYCVKRYSNPLLIDVFICFGRFFEHSFDFKFRVFFQKVKNSKRVTNLVHSAFGKNTGSEISWCTPFTCFTRLDNQQFQAQCLLLSVVEKIDEFGELLNYYKNPVFRNPVNRVRAILSKKYTALVKIYEQSCKVGQRRPVKKAPVKPVEKKPFCIVTHAVGYGGVESFCVKYRDGGVKTVPNDKFAVRNLFNLTCGEGGYTIHKSALTPDGSRFFNHDNEYCWLDAFFLAKKKIPDFTIPYPAISYRHLLSCGLGKVLADRVKFYPNGKAHFTAKTIQKGQKSNWSALVGVKLDEDSGMSLKNVDVFFDDICSGIVNQTALRSDNDLMTNVVRRISDQLNSISSRAKDLKISVCLSSADKKKLCEVFPDLSLEFTDSSFSSHALFTAMRSCENFCMSKRNNFCNFIDAGGDVVHYIQKRCADVHVCCPVVDIKDAQRHMTRSNLLDKTQGLQESITICGNLCQDCKVAKQNIVAVEVYDMTLNDMAKAILSHKAKRFDFSLIIPPEITECSCEVKMFGDQLTVKSDGEKVKYYYGSSGECYSHSVDNLRHILKTQIFSFEGVVFKKTLEQSREGLHFFSLVPCPNILNGRYEISTHYRKSEMDKVMMIIPVRNKFGIIENVKVKVDKSIVYHLLEYTMNTALRVDDKAIEYLISQFRARKSVSIKGGKVIQVPFDLPVDLYPGFLGVILGEGIRMREKTHYMAKMSYYKHYLPTIFFVIGAYINRCISYCREYTYNKMIQGLKWIMSESFIEEMINGDKRIFDVIEVFEFTQTVNIVGEENHRNVMNESFSTFLNESNKKMTELDKTFKSIEDEFKDTDLDILRDTVMAGGAGNSWRSMFNFNVYNKVYSFFSFFVSCKNKVVKFTNFVFNVIMYLVGKGKDAFVTAKDALKSLMYSLIGKGKNVCKDTVKLFRRASDLMTSKFSASNSKWIEELEALIDEDEKAQTVPQTEMVEMLPLSFSPEDEEKFAAETAASIEKMVVDICTSGGGVRTPNCIKVLCSVPRRISERVKIFLETLREHVRVVVNWIVLRYFDIIEIPSLIKEYYEYAFNVSKAFILSPDGLSIIIQGSAFCLTNMLFMAIAGDFSMVGLALSGLVLIGIKTLGWEKKYLGNGVVSSQIASSLCWTFPFGVMSIPVRALLSNFIESKMKSHMLTVDTLKEPVRDLVAKDVITYKAFEKVTFSTIRQCIYAVLLGMIFAPSLCMTILICLLFVNEHKKYLNSVVLQTNIKLSFAEVLRKTAKSDRLNTFKSLAVRKFKNSNIRDDSNENSADVKVAGEGKRFVDDMSDVEVEFDYDGSYKEKSKILSEKRLGSLKPSTSQKIVWADTSDTSSLNETAESLKFSHLTPSTDRRYINCRVSFGLSNIILTYPCSSLLQLIETEDIRLNSIAEYYYLEAQKLCIELGKIDNAVRIFNSKHSDRKTFKDVVWDMRNMIDDATTYISDNGKKWYRLKRGDTSAKALEGMSKFSLDQHLTDFNSDVKGVQFTSDEFLGMYTNNKCLGLEKFLDEEGKFVLKEEHKNVRFFNKPPGAGKTTTIVENIVRDINSGRKCLALTCTSAGKKEIIHKLRTKSVVSPQIFVSTYDSLLMNGNSPVVENLYCDEIFMVHCGQWLACLNQVECSLVECYGDKNQIPYINRVPNTISRYSFQHFMDYPMEHDNKSYRCPQDVCYLLSNLKDVTGELLYPRGVYAAGKNADVNRSMFVESMHSLDDVKFDKDCKYIAFTQPEKEEISRSASNAFKESFSANTVNEVQGGTFPEVNLLRIRQYDNPIYSNINQFVVSISRHTDRMCYRTVPSKLNDFVGEKISALSTVSDYVIKEYKFRQRV